MTIVGQKLSTKALKAAFDAAVILEIPKVNWNLTSENLGCEKHKSIPSTSRRSTSPLLLRPGRRS
jgi:hypothetical protein